ncbi:MAG: hypothetical protein ABJQ29_15480 [Luteolibacter sp.]
MKRAMQIFFGVLLLGLIIFVATREPKRPALPRWESQGELLDSAVENAKEKQKYSSDADLVKGLLQEDLSGRDFDFALVSEAVSGKKVIPVTGRESAERVISAISEVMAGLLVELNADDSPVKGLRRINEGSRFFEDGLLERLNGMDGISCEIPQTREGSAQRSGYPDLRIIDEKTADIYYLDPKLMERGSSASSLRTFYFEPKDRTLKILDDATHLLIGIEHDGNDGDWEFLGYRLVDLSKLKVRLKAEFQASNRDIYPEASVLEMKIKEGKEGAK